MRFAQPNTYHAAYRTCAQKHDSDTHECMSLSQNPQDVFYTCGGVCGNNI